MAGRKVEFEAKVHTHTDGEGSLSAGHVGLNAGTRSTEVEGE